MRYAIVFNNFVENIVEWDGVSPSTLLPGRSANLAQDIFVSVGWNWNNGVPTNPIPPPPPPPPFDFSNLDNLDKTLKAMGLVIANFTGKTPAQTKAAFLTAYQSLNGG